MMIYLDGFSRADQFINSAFLVFYIVPDNYKWQQYYYKHIIIDCILQ